MSESAKEGPALSETVQEVQGWFPDDATLQAALGKLTLAGHDRADFSLPEEQVLANPATATPNESAVAPETPIDHQQIRTMNAGIAGSTGGMIAAGAVVATGGAAALAIGAAAAAGLGAMAISEGIGKGAEQAKVNEHNRRGAVGTLVLALHVTDQAKAEQAVQVMRESGATRTKLVTRTNEALTAGVSASSWTG
jgi:hypothetical protein